MLPRLLLMTLVMSAWLGGGRDDTPALIPIVRPSRKRAAAPPVLSAASAGGGGGETVPAGGVTPARTDWRPGLLLPLLPSLPLVPGAVVCSTGGGGGATTGSTFSGGGGGGAIAAVVSGAVGATAFLDRIVPITATTMITATTPSSTRISCALLLRRPDDSALGVHVVAGATDIRRGAAPGLVCGVPGMFSICNTSELVPRDERPLP